MIRADGCYLRPIEERDLKMIRDYNMIHKNNMLRRWPITDFEHRKWFENPPKDAVHFSVCSEEGELVGVIGLRGINWIDRNGDLVILIWKTGKGYGTDSINAFKKYVFEDLGLHKIYLRALQSNEIAIKCYEKCGFKREGVFNGEIFSDGTFQNIIRMGLINE